MRIRFQFGHKRPITTPAEQAESVKLHRGWQETEHVKKTKREAGLIVDEPPAFVLERLCPNAPPFDRWHPFKPYQFEQSAADAKVWYEKHKPDFQFRIVPFAESMAQFNANESTDSAK